MNIIIDVVNYDKTNNYFTIIGYVYTVYSIIDNNELRPSSAIVNILIDMICIYNNLHPYRLCRFVKITIIFMTIMIVQTKSERNNDNNNNIHNDIINN